MLSKSTAAEQAGHTAPDLELVNYGEGFAWLRPDRERAELDAAIRDAAALDYDMTRTLGWPEGHRALQERIALTDAGRDALARELAMEALFGPWPNVAEACALNGVA